MSIPRPLRNDPAIRAAAVQQLVDECVKWDADSPCRATWTSAFDRIALSQNGYEIARDLERYANVMPDAELVEILDSASGYLWSAHDRAVEEWVEANSITAPSSSAKPRVSTSDMNLPIWRGGKLTTAATWRPGRSTSAWFSVICALDFFWPIVGPKSISSL